MPGERLSLTRLGSRQVGRGALGKCAKPRVDHASITGFVAINGPWTRMTRKLIWINDSIGELSVQFQTVGVLLAKFRLIG